METIQRVTRMFNGKELVLETGKVAKQASGAVILRYGDITILSSSVGAKRTDLSLDFFPLTVVYNEKYYAGGKIPGGFLRREGKPRDKEVLTSRIIDRPLRPLFPDGLRNDVQIIPTLLSTDGLTLPDTHAVVAASASTCISWLPFGGPVGAIRVGRIDGAFVLNPNIKDLERSDLDIIVAGTKDAVLMIEGEAKEVSETVFIDAIKLAHKEMQPLIEMQEELIGLCKVEKREVELFKVDEELVPKIRAFAKDKLKAASFNSDKEARHDGVEAVYALAKEHFEAELPEELHSQISVIMHMIEEEVVREGIVLEGKRPDGRSMEEIRPITAEINFLPRVHGSGLFTRGQTQALAVVTLGSEKDAQLIDDLFDSDDKDFLLHYNFPPFSVGETGRFGAPGRREIGHGNLAERSFNAVRPDKETSPYTIRIVSEILESNGSSSMATICASSIAMMNAGVKLTSNVAGIAMGLAYLGDKYKVLTDIQGVEDHLGDMDFKVAGTRKGITAFQLDIKMVGISTNILDEALEQAKRARLHILDILDATIKEPAELPPTAPQFKIIHINPERIKDLIGPSGKHIKGIIEKTGSSIDVDNSGKVVVFAADDDKMQKTMELIDGYTKDPDIGEEFDGIISGVKDFGFFVEIMPGIEGMCHVSELEYTRVEDVHSYAQVGDPLRVKVMNITRDGKIDLSHKATMPVPEGWTPPPPREPRGDRGRGGDRGGRGGDRGGRGGRDRR